MSKCDDDIILEAYLNKFKKVNEDFEFFEEESIKKDDKKDDKKDKKIGSETKSFEQPKNKLTEDEAKEFFANSDAFHQAFHNFMKETGYSEKEIDGKEMWCKCKKSFDEDEQQVAPQTSLGSNDNSNQQNQNVVNQNNQPVQNQNNIEQQKQEIIQSLSQMTPEQITATYQAIFS